MKRKAENTTLSLLTSPLVRNLSLRKVIFHGTIVPLKFNISPGQASNVAAIMISIQSDLKHVISPEASIGLNTHPIKLSTVVTHEF